MTEADPRRWEALPVILVATFMGLFDIFVVNVAAPAIQNDLGSSSSELQLVVAGYAFAYAAFMVTGGRLGDRYSYRRLFLGGMALFTVASAACGLAGTSAELIGARFVQGFGAAMMVPQVLALITALFPPGERHRALAWFGVTIGIGAITGQILGGALVQLDLFGWGWRLVFFVNIPIGIVTLLLGARLLPHNRSATRPQLDPVGVIGVTCALGLALIPLMLGRSQGWPSWLIVSLALAIPVGVLTLLYEARLARRGGQPVLDLTLFEARSFSSGLVVNACVFAYFGSILLGLTLFMQRGLGMSALEAGLSFAPLGVGLITMSLLARPLIARHGARVVTGGLVIVFFALIGMLLDIHLSGTAMDPARLAPVFLAIGIGNGCVVPALIGVSLTDVQPQKAGAAAGTLATIQQFATVAGIAVLSEIFFAAVGQPATEQSYLTAIQYVILLDIGFVVASFVASLFLPRVRAAVPARSHPPVEPVAAAESV